MSTANKQNGFVKIIVILIVLILVFTLSGFNIRDGASIDNITSKTESTGQKIQQLYETHAQSVVSQYIIDPGLIVGSTINNVFIDKIKLALSEIISDSEKSTLPDWQIPVLNEKIMVN
jgi:uncharacterized protein (UPF0333 family)